MRAALLITAAFAISAIALLGALPLWLDEILQLLETRDTATAQMIARLPRNAGAAPLGYLVQHASLRITGYSVRRARLPAAVFGILSVLAVAMLAREMELRRAAIAAILFAMLPEILRYSTESRVYSQALFFSVVATLAYLRLVRKPGWRTAVAFGLALMAAAYTQPYAIFVGLALVIWSVLCRDRRSILHGGIAFALCCAAFLPWYLWAKARWASDVVRESYRFTLSGKTGLMIFREAAGAGYWGSGLLLILCLLAIARPSDGSRRRSLLALLIAVPILGALAADASAGYFIAVRQFLWILPAAAILAAIAIEPVAPFHRLSLNRSGSVLAAALLCVCIRQSIVFFRAPHEDWQAAADAVAERSQDGGCVEIAPADSLRLYEFFRPEIASAACGNANRVGSGSGASNGFDRRDSNRVILAITPATSIDQRVSALARLKSSGYAQESESAAGLSSILVFRRTGTPESRP